MSVQPEELISMLLNKEITNVEFKLRVSALSSSDRNRADQEMIRRLRFDFSQSEIDKMYQDFGNVDSNKSS